MTDQPAPGLCVSCLHEARAPGQRICLDCIAARERRRTLKETVIVAKKALAAIGIGTIATGAALTVAFGTGQRAHADNTFGGAGETITRSAAPTTLDTPSAAPSVTAEPFSGGQGNGGHR